MGRPLPRHCQVLKSERSSATTALTTGLMEISNARPTPEVPPFPVIYRTYFDFVWRNARRLGVGPRTIDDVVQEVFIVIHSRLATLNEPSALRSWIYGIVRRTALSHIRLDRARGESPLDPADENAAASLRPTPLEVAEHTDQVKLLWRLLEDLDGPKREAFILVELEEMTMPEIAQALELPLGTVYSRVRAARQAFEAAFARHSARTKRGGAR
jgi:RNA polymerase sigma-70 factor, ECF subfamily